MASLKKGTNKIKAAADLKLSESGLNEKNCVIVFEHGKAVKSWKPEGNLNSLQSFTAGNDYTIEAKKNFEIKGL